MNTKDKYIQKLKKPPKEVKSAEQVLLENEKLFVEEHPFDEMYVGTKDAILKCMEAYHTQFTTQRQVTDKEVYELIRDVHKEKLKGKGNMGIGWKTLGEIEWMELCLYVVKAMRDNKIKSKTQ